MNISEATKLRHAMRAMVLDGIEDSEQDKAKYIKERFESEYLCDYNRNQNRQDLVEDWLRGCALHVPIYNNEVVSLYESVLGRPLSDGELDTELDRYWTRLAVVVLGIIRGVE